MYLSDLSHRMHLDEVIDTLAKRFSSLCSSHSWKGNTQHDWIWLDYFKLMLLFQQYVLTSSVIFPIIFSSRVCLIKIVPLSFHGDALSPGSSVNRWIVLLSLQKWQKSYTCDFMHCKIIWNIKEINSWKRNAEHCKIMFEILSHHFPAETFMNLIVAKALRSLYTESEIFACVFSYSQS